MAASIFMYEGDGLLHTAPRRPAALATDPAQPLPAADTAERRSEALRRFFPKIGAWLADRMYFARMREVEAFLSEATDAADLETRIRRIERGTLARF